MNNKNTKISESNRFKLDLTDKLNLKDPKKSWLQPVSVFITLGKTSNQNTAAINVKILLQLGMLLLIY